MDLTDIIKDLKDGENMGGLPQRAYYGLHKDVFTWPTRPTSSDISSGGELTGDLVMAYGKQMHEIYITDDMGELKIEPVGEADGKSYIMRFSFFHPGLRAKLLGFFNAVKNENMVFVVPDNNGLLYLLGDALRAAVFTSSPDGAGTSRETAGRRGASFEFVYKTSQVCTFPGSIINQTDIPENAVLALSGTPIMTIKNEYITI